MYSVIEIRHVVRTRFKRSNCAREAVFTFCRYFTSSIYETASVRNASDEYAFVSAFVYQMHVLSATGEISLASKYKYSDHDGSRAQRTHS